MNSGTRVQRRTFKYPPQTWIVTTADWKNLKQRRHIAKRQFDRLQTVVSKPTGDVTEAPSMFFTICGCLWLSVVAASSQL